MAGTLIVTTLSDGTNSTSATNAIKGSVKAWANFNGISGSVALNKSYNMSSVTRNAVGDYSVSFTSSTTDSSYSFSGSVINSSFSTTADNSVRTVMPYTGTIATTGIRMFSKFANAAATGQEDENIVCCSMVGN